MKRNDEVHSNFCNILRVELSRVLHPLPVPPHKKVIFFTFLSNTLYSSMT